MKEAGLKQKELAGLLGWSPQDLNDVPKGRKAVGAYRMRHMMDSLGDFFSQDLLRRLGGKKAIPEMVSEAVAPHFYRNDIERKYAGKLFEILRGPDEQSALAVKACIDMGYRLRREKNKVDAAYIGQLKVSRGPVEDK